MLGKKKVGPVIRGEEVVVAAVRSIVAGLREVVREEVVSALSESGTGIAVPKSEAACAPGYLSVSEAAIAARKTAATIREWIRSDKLKAAKPAGSREFLIKRADLETCLSGADVAEVDISQRVAEIMCSRRR